MSSIALGGRLGRRLVCWLGPLVLAIGCSAGARPSAPLPSAAASPAAASPAALTDTDRLIRDLCAKQIVVLGEANMHGGAATLEARVAIARRLIAECEFRTVFLESGMYDFLDLRHKRASGQPTTPEQLRSAVGLMMMGTARESEAWLTYLATATSAGSIELFGIQDSIHSTAIYARRELAAALARHLPTASRSRCQAELERHTDWRYDDANPFSPEVRARLVGCVTEVEAALSRPTTIRERDDAAMAASLHRLFDRAFVEDAVATSNSNDRSLYLNLQAQLVVHPSPKSIVFCATVHGARQLPGDRAAVVPLGAHLHEAYGDRMATIAFSAYAGRYAMYRRPISELPPAAADSIEGLAFAAASPGTVLRYLDRAALTALGPRAARPLTYQPVVAAWDAIVDGLVVQREERAPTVVLAPPAP
jgi:erythromycin esterase-like protein